MRVPATANVSSGTVRESCEVASGARRARMEAGRGIGGGGAAYVMAENVEGTARALAAQPAGGIDLKQALHCGANEHGVE